MKLLFPSLLKERGNMTNLVICGMGYGDCGKGSIVDHYCSKDNIASVVRFNSGPQAGHRVSMNDGRDHIFSQWGAGTFRNVPTFHSRFMALDPISMEPEANHLIEQGVKDPYSLITVDPNCLIVTPFHKAWNRFQELARGSERHGSCGMGYGAAVEHSINYPGEALRVRDIINGGMESKLQLQHSRFNDFMYENVTIEELQEYYLMWVFQVNVARPDHLKNLSNRGSLIFEGAQGVLLDEWYGFHPYTTWSTTTFKNAMTLLNANGLTATKIGVLRAYATRHGAGPLVTEDHTFQFPNHEHNKENGWQGPFRLGHFDAVVSKYACRIAKPDVLALTHLDNASKLDHYAVAHWGWENTIPRLVPTDFEARSKLTEKLMDSSPVYVRRTTDWVSTIKDLLKVPIAIESWGPTAKDKSERT